MKPRKVPFPWVFILTLVLLTAVLAAAAVHGRKRAIGFKTLHVFTGASDGDGNSPTGRPILDRKGNLYGTTEYGGANDTGTVFELSPNGSSLGWTEKVLYSFEADGGNECNRPLEQLIFDKHGNLYGAAPGPYWGAGCVFELSPNRSGGWTETMLYLFTGGSDGGNPGGSLIMDKAGNLYGVASDGGGGVGCSGYGCGTVWELSPNGSGGWNFTTLHVFDGVDGDYPIGGLNRDSSGNLWGKTAARSYGENGVVFELTRNGGGTWTFHLIHTFSGTGGRAPGYGRLVFGKHGHVFGTTEEGGTNGHGTIFVLIPTGGDSYKLTDIYNFGGYNQDGIFPDAGLRFDKAGHLYGTTQFGGWHNYYGTVFELIHSSSGWTETILHSFDFFDDGAYPVAGVNADRKGHFYGTTSEGGGGGGCRRYGCGTVYEITP